MKIDKRLISHVAMVARLKLSDDELAKFTPQLSETLSFFEDIANAETEGIGISMQPVPMADSLREDRPIPCLSQEEALHNSKDNKDGYFKGPKSV